MLFATLLFAFSAAASPWRMLPIAGGGCMTGIEISPSSPNVWYSFADVSGPYRSDDAGRTWRPLHVNCTAAERESGADRLRGLLIDPRDPDRIVFAAGCFKWGRTDGLYVSRDGGRTKQKTAKVCFSADGTSSRLYGRILARNPRASEELLAASAGDGIFCSTDGGESWTPCGGDGYEFTAVLYDQANPNRAYASAPRDDGLGMKLKSGFWRSDDGGRTWRLLDGVAGPHTMAQIPGAAEIVGVFDEGRVSRLRCSRDGGATWTDYHQGILSDTKAPAWRNSGKIHGALAAGPDFLVVCEWDGTTYRRRAADAAWRKVELESLRQGNPVSEEYLSFNNFKRGNCRFATNVLTIDPSDPNHFVTGDWYDLWETRDGGRNWVTRIDTINNVVPFVLACDPHSADNILFGLADHVLLASNDSGKSFRGKFFTDDPTHSVNDATDIAWSAKRPGRAYAVGGKSWWMMGVTDDGGRHWRWLTLDGLTRDRAISGKGGVFGVAVDPATDDVYVCLGRAVAPGKGGVYRLRDGAGKWEWFSEGLPQGARFFRESEFDGLHKGGLSPQLVFSHDGSALLFGKYGDAAYRLDREAGRWVKLAAKYPGARLTCAADPSVPGRFLVAHEGGVDEYTDGGRTCRRNLLSCLKLAYSIAFDAHMPGLVAALSKDGDQICVSRDGGVSWAALSDGMRFPAGIRQRLVLDRGRLFALASGNGVWVRQIW
jgi:hypothetical protein